MTAAIAAGILVAAGVYLIFQRGLVRVTIGFVLLGHAANVIVVAAGGMALRGVPLVGSGELAGMADPLTRATFSFRTFRMVLPLSARDAVAIETPASRATSCRVAGGRRRSAAARPSATRRPSRIPELCPGGGTVRPAGPLKDRTDGVRLPILR